MILEKNDTIAAISTPPGFGGIGVVRISGSNSQKIAREIFRPTSQHISNVKKAALQPPNPPFIPRKMYHGYISVPGQKKVVDEVLLVFMPAPNSYTMEDVVEIQAHGGAIVLENILEIVLEQGARLADAGEFTRRAYLNGRIDLTQAEAVIDIINAKTEASLNIATRHLEGKVGELVTCIKEGLEEIHAIMEADIEFPEDIGEKDHKDVLCSSTLKGINNSLNEILEGYQKGHLLRDGLRLTILGKVNVGKSSLLNRFMQKERAIVTEVPGTTRDHIEEALDIYGLPIILIDTAGWRDTTDPVEKIGVDRTRNLAETADLILFMVDAQRGFLTEDHDIYQRIQNKEKILVINKTDLISGEPRITVPENWSFFDVTYTSVKYDQGIDTLKKQIHRFGTEGWVGQESVILPNLRQKKLFERAQLAVQTSLEGINGKIHPELTVMDLKEAMEALDEITGASVKADVLDAIFSRFCIGK